MRKYGFYVFIEMEKTLPLATVTKFFSINFPVSSLEDDLKTFWNDSCDGNLCDITMVVGETHIRAHKVIVRLLMYSPFFCPRISH